MVFDKLFIDGVEIKGVRDVTITTSRQRSDAAPQPLVACGNVSFEMAVKRTTVVNLLTALNETQDQN